MVVVGLSGSKIDLGKSLVYSCAFGIENYDPHDTRYPAPGHKTGANDASHSEVG